MTTRTDGKIAIVLVDDHVLVREGIREILSAEGDIVVVAEAANSEEAIGKVVQHRPDIVLLDVEIPGRQAAETVARMRLASATSRIIMLSMYDAPIVLRKLIAEGISGYLLKSVDRKELVAAVRSVYQSPERMVLSISRESLAQLHGSHEKSLSARELAILRLVAQALSNSQIATRMHVTEATVKRHLHGVFVKLGAVSRIDAVNKAIAGGLLAGHAREGGSMRRD
ncbi:response regulator transcription factor [Actinocrinis puniceicyclus]|uniref:Response regulator transcription factor n=1 Tax=Actinocrinis puniceicyclus TaxID=977794 RepID=A0A8J7WK01_9ACTN|nr:response regulator transcription factor [Actinocrinis puniceicyclus]MBS2963691.1 response regulator transcription factor [Actinocrinis puniceicyclus]